MPAFFLSVYAHIHTYIHTHIHTLDEKTTYFNNFMLALEHTYIHAYMHTYIYHFIQMCPATQVYMRT
jgi:hypothetical protein